MKTQSKTGLAIILSLIVVGLAALSSPVLGHHGTGVAYDGSKPTVVKGTVTEFGWKNPHARLFIDAKDESGTVQHWAVEMNSPGVMIKQGWTQHQFKPGDDVTITVYPSRTGALVGSCIGACKVMINGKDATPKPAQPGEQF